MLSKQYISQTMQKRPFKFRRGPAIHRPFRGTLALLEKRSGTRFKSSKTAFSPSAGVFQGPRHGRCIVGPLE